MRVTRWLGSVLREEVPVQRFDRLRTVGIDAYELVGVLPRGPARVSAWSAYAFQTYADKLIAATPTPGYLQLDVAEMAQSLYLLVGPCLARAGELAALPQSPAGTNPAPPMPHWHTPIRSRSELVGMREALDALRTYVAADLEASEADAASLEQLRRLLAAIDAKFELEGLWLKRPPAEIRGRVGALLSDGIDTAYTLGQLLADPELHRRLFYKFVR